MPTSLKFPGHALQDEGVVSSKVEAHFARQFAKLDATTALGLKLVKANDGMIVPRTLGKGPQLVMHLYAKLLKTVRAIRVVASLSLVEDGQVLCRTLCETVVAIRYILAKNTARRADEYVAHTLMRTKNIARKWSKTPGLKRNAKHLDELTAGYLPAYTYLGEGRLNELKEWYYGRRPMRELFKEVGLEKVYQVLYLQFAGIQHVSDAAQHAEIGDKGKITLLLGSQGEGQMNLLLHATNALLWLTISRLSRKFKLGYQAEIESMKPEHRVHEALRAWRRRRRGK